MTKKECEEQIQEDIIAFIDSVVLGSSDEYRKNVLCQIVGDNFKKLEASDHKSLLAELGK
jgi:hypothetical protein|tara:strand:- start:340 stop:519 length:180 start_codon:yes stop_codon:yes gene_type:complete